jgi:hypothetical protein
MKISKWILGGVITALALAVLAYFWVTGDIDAITYFRSVLADNPPAAGEPLGEPATRRVVFVLIDGLRLDTAENAAVMPTLAELRDQGAWAVMHSVAPSYSEAGYSTLMTGAWPEINDGPAFNRDYGDIPTWTQDNLFTAAHRAGLTTAVSGYYWFENLIPQDAVDASFYTPGEDRYADEEVMNAAMPWLESGEYNFILIHLDQVDYAGHHEGGGVSQAWDEAASRCDAYLAQIAATLDFSQDTLVVLSDHGHIAIGGHGGQDYEATVEPFLMVGAGVHSGGFEDILMVDVAPTLAALLGTNIPATAQGEVRTQMLELPESTLAALPAAVEAQQQQLVTAYTTAIDRPVVSSDLPTGDDVSVYQTLMSNVRNARLKSERLPRAVLALVILMFTSSLLSRRYRKEFSWLLSASFVYLAIFNIRYALIDHLTYSFSSVTGATDLVIYTCITAAIAFIPAWLIAALGLKLFKRDKKLAAESSMGLLLLTLYILALPVTYSYVLDGALPVWALPQFLPNFLMLISLVQMIPLAILGLLLTGVTALIAKPVPEVEPAK